MENILSDNTDSVNEQELTRTADRDTKKVFFKRRKGCPLMASGQEVSYKNPELLRRFVSEGGRILPRRITGVCSSYQRKLKSSVKLARILALMPF
jgi:small subunit ribosomal protein S18